MSFYCPRNFFCTYSDENYLPHVLALLSSLRAQEGTFRLLLLCLTEEAFRRAQPLQGDDFRICSIRDLESADPELYETKNGRSTIEYYFTCTPCWTRLAMEKEPEAEWMTYLDADLYFYQSPNVIMTLLEKYSVGITPHRFPESLRHLEAHGKFNVGWVSFRRDTNGKKCLEDWRIKCLEWCYDRAEDGRYGDQKYLDEWPDRFSRVKVLNDRGINLASWNVGGGKLTAQQGGVRINGQPLIFYHFSGLRQLRPGFYDPQWSQHAIRPCRVLRNLVYRPYVRKLERCRQNLQKSEVIGSNRYQEKALRHNIGWWKLLRRTLRGDYIKV
jgi:hypothetical protein